MINLAVHYGRGVVQLRQIAQDENISEKYLSQIVIPMRNRGLLLSTRGTNGGHALAKSPALITLRDIVEAVDGDIALVDGVGVFCGKDSDCVTREVWQSLSGTIISELDKVSLQEMADRVHGRQDKKSIGDYDI